MVQYLIDCKRKPKRSTNVLNSVSYSYHITAALNHLSILDHHVMALCFQDCLRKAKKELKSGDNVEGIDNDEDRKKSIAWLETFFVGELKVVAPMPIGCDIVRRAWEKEHTWQVEHAKWMEERGEIGDNTIQTTSRQKSWTNMSQAIRVPSTNSSNSRRSVDSRQTINTRHSSLSSSPLSLRRHKSEDAMLKRE
mgnify:CR=1 FL=1